MPATPYRTALVTGASRGIGAALCRRLAGLGLTVHALARSREGLEALAADAAIRPLVADVTDIAAVEAALAGAEIDVLVNNAGAVASVRPLYEQTAQEIAETVAVNLTAPLQLMRLLVPGMVARRRGHVVNITTTAARHVFAGTSAYGGAKAGLAQAGRVLRYDLAGSNVRLTEVAPGRVETEIYLRAFGGDRGRLQGTLYSDVRALQPEDVAEAVAAVLTLPEHVDVAEIEVSPTDQATGGHVYGKPA
ncbi:SDR family oxidoreductase [Labrys wisconsinensis]|uniref:NADP-dependent 3-hydroxy acid dehydrogenase YdfG n=1 Tax=Labrys wisconsinensis TaxID=425677 RepID=A0ABU0J0Y0_9HYPH|nr:SDR family oxidoreductase [Labrys wisconsinensis]MDQ0467921.1 NADP-dependent 3-hydroxy acid dehydrogenase YdfG [Labrys wisconsinensis]